MEKVRNYFFSNIFGSILVISFGILTGMALFSMPYKMVVLSYAAALFLLISKQKIEVNLIVAIFVLAVTQQMVEIELNIVRGVSIKNLLLYMLVAISFIKRRRGGGYKLIKSGNIWFAFFIFQIVFTLYNYFFSPYVEKPFYSLTIIKVTVDFILLLFALGNFEFDETDISSILKLFFISTSILSIYNIFLFNFSSQLTVLEMDKNRNVGILGDPNVTAVFLSTILPMGLYFIFTQKKRIIKFLYVLFFFSIVTNILTTSSRAGIISAIVAIFIVFQKRFKLLKGFFVLAFGVTIVVGTLFIFFSDYEETLLFQRLNPYSSFFDVRDQGAGLEAYTSGRTFLWQKAIESLKERPLTGFGANSFRWWLYENYNVEMPPHNMYLTMFVDFGLTTGLVFLLLIGKILLDSFKAFKSKVKNAEIYFALFAAYAIGMLSLEMYFNNLLLIFSFLMYQTIELHHKQK